MKKLSFKRTNVVGAMGTVEAVIALALAAMSIGAVVTGLFSSLRMTASSNLSQAAQLLAIQGLEQTRAARWDAVTYPVVDEVLSTNFPPRGYVLEWEKAGNKPIYATNYTTITTISTNPWVKFVRVDCVYRCMGIGLLTNSVASYRGTEAGQQNATEISLPSGGTPPSLPSPEGTKKTKNNRGNNDHDDDDD